MNVVKKRRRRRRRRVRGRRRRRNVMQNTAKGVLQVHVSTFSKYFTLSWMSSISTTVGS